jgi:hypothetical protein
MSDDRRWFDSSQPQTLQGAVMLCYLTAVFALVAILRGFYPGYEIIPLALGVAGYGVANEKKWGYRFGVILAGLNLLEYLYLVFRGAFGFFFTLLFAIVLMGLFAHSQSREYERIWFR